ncbi:hypothetical protein ACPPVO_01465 [Dactylosporangium sp. McL0621]|uniref:hypothetical protein n=1 Tax=Dactylosporangium sp. McL0621 TaxID=3415678 RepID=UPI003CE77970
MRDIVATIQPEQVELVRAELDESICVQGAPGTGTGKTSLAVRWAHRSAQRFDGGQFFVDLREGAADPLAAVLPLALSIAAARAAVTPSLPLSALV